MRTRPKLEVVKLAEPAVAQDFAPVKVASAPPVPTTFETIGYMEKPGGQVEAIIVQDNEVQFVHLGDLIAGKYRVTKISPDWVDAVDETQVQAPMAKDDRQSVELTSSVEPQRPAPALIVAPAQREPWPLADEGTGPASPHGVEPVSTVRAAIAKNHPGTPLGSAKDNKSAAQGEPPVTASLGIVQKADGQVDTVVADGDTVRLVPQVPTVEMARSAPWTSLRAVMARMGTPSSAIQPNLFRVPAPAPEAAEKSSADFPTKSMTMKPLGFVEKGDGEFAAILSQDDEIYIVRQGDRFAGRYRALRVSADAVEALEEPPERDLPPFSAPPPELPGLLSASIQQKATLPNGTSGLPARRHGQDNHARGGASVLPAKHGQDNHATASGISPVGRDEKDGHDTFIFQTLGYVESQNGALQAIVADGPEVYVVKQGDTFADRYRATSVDPLLVLAVRVPPEQHGENFLSAQTKPGGKPASNEMDRYLSRWINAQAFHEVDASAVSVFAALDANLLSLSLTGLDLQSHLFMADKPKAGF